MPATYAHYTFGKRVYTELGRKEKQDVNKVLDAYLLGLHGPDLLFYYYSFRVNRINRQGRDMHRQSAAEFFEKGRKLWRQSRDPALKAYLYGFLCHFILDSECHPYVKYYMEEKNLGHLTIETEFDRYLMVRDGKDPLAYVPVHHLVSRARTRRAASLMFDRVSPRQIGVCIHQFRLTIAAFVCRKPWKRISMKKLSRIMGQDKQIGGLIMDGRVHPRCAGSNHFLEERLERAVPVAVREIEAYERALESREPLSKRLYRNYEEFPCGN